MFLVFSLLLTLVISDDSNCPSPWVESIGSPTCFHPYAVKETFFGALNYCNKRDASLASIHNGFQNTQIYTASAELLTQCDYWIGLSDFDQPLNFTWTDNSAYNYHAFKQGYPKADGYTAAYIAVHEGNARWVNTDDLNERMCFVCMKPKGALTTTQQTRTIKYSTQSSTITASTTTPSTTSSNTRTFPTTPTTYSNYFTTSYFTMSTTYPTTASTYSTTHYTNYSTASQSTARKTSTEETTSTSAQMTTVPIPLSCSDLPANSASGVYTISNQSFYCDMDYLGGGWTALFRRLDDSIPFEYLSIEAFNSSIGSASGTHWQPFWWWTQITSHGNSELLLRSSGDRSNPMNNYFAFELYSNFKIDISQKVFATYQTGNMTNAYFNFATQAAGNAFRQNSQGYYNLGSWWAADDFNPNVAKAPMFPLGQYKGTGNYGFYVCSGSGSDSCITYLPVTFEIFIRTKK